MHLFNSSPQKSSVKTRNRKIKITSPPAPLPLILSTIFNYQEVIYLSVRRKILLQSQFTKLEFLNMGLPGILLTDLVLHYMTQVEILFVSKTRESRREASICNKE